MGDNVSVLLVSFYEGGFQPISIASAAAYLRYHGYGVRTVDAFVQPLHHDILDGIKYVGVSLQLFQSLDSAVSGIELLRRTGRPIILFGQHASLIPDLLLEKGLADWVIRGDWELPLVLLLERLEKNAGSFEPLPVGVCGHGELKPAYVHRGPLFLAPDRSGLPPLSSYTYPAASRILNLTEVITGNVEASRGCHHACTYCSVFGAYGKKVALIPIDIVMRDIRNCVNEGAQHICFVDAEFLNSRSHGVAIARAMHREFPKLTFDFTARADHLLECRMHLEEMVALGARFVTSALEFPKPEVLNSIVKELTVDQCVAASRLCEEIGLRLNPTFLTFNPWTTIEDLDAFTVFLKENGLDEHVDPLQLETRLHLPKGSPLLTSTAIMSLELTEHDFHYEWKHPDPRVDETYFRIFKPTPPGEFRRCCIKC